MTKLLQVLLSPLLLALIGVAALSAVVWWIGPLIGIGESRPLDGVWARVIVIAILLDRKSTRLNSSHRP